MKQVSDFANYINTRIKNITEQEQEVNAKLEQLQVQSQHLAKKRERFTKMYLDEVNK